MERIIIFDPSVCPSQHDPNSTYFADSLRLDEGFPREAKIKERQAHANHDDICNILYTGGTAGKSKRVILAYRMYQVAMDMNRKSVSANEKDRAINLLLFSHVFERSWVCLSLAADVELIVNTYPKGIQQSMHEAHPTGMTSVPRFWEKAYVAVEERIDKPNVVQCKLFHHTLNIERGRNIQYLTCEKRAPLALKMEYKFVSKIVLSLARKQLDLENPHFPPTAGVYASPEVEEFIHSIGITMTVGYGLTEGLATVTCDHVGWPHTVGSVGRSLEGTDIKISDEDEVMPKGPTIVPGCFRRGTTNAKALDKDGYFHASGAGCMKDGELFLKERIKGLLKTSSGERITPQMVEAMLLVDKSIEQVPVITDQRKFVSTLIVPECPVLEEWAKKNHIEFRDREELYQDERVNDMMREHIETLQQRLALHEKIKRFTLSVHHFPMEDGELTNTLKLKRLIINRRYHDVIERVYEEQGSK